MLDKRVIKVRVSGEFACFTRPDLKVERMTYPCMTPSAARGVLDAILWKPEFQWYVRRIFVLKPVKFMTIKRNEIKKKQSKIPLIIEEERVQRNSVVLKDVAYVIEASVYQKALSEKNPPKKYIEMFERRVRKGQCWRRPYLGTREFSAEFEEVHVAEVPAQDIIPIGSMLFDIFYDEKGKPEPLFFYDVVVRDGVLNCEIPENDRMMQSSHICPPVDSEVSSAIYEFNKREEEEATR